MLLACDYSLAETALAVLKSDKVLNSTLMQSILVTNNNTSCVCFVTTALIKINMSNELELLTSTELSILSGETMKGMQDASS